MKRTNAGTTVVQDYAKKRQAQLERARHLKETRQSAPRVKHSVNDGEDLSAPSVLENPTGDPAPRERERVIHLTEVRLMRGVKTGIITTSQANQLWQLFCEENCPPQKDIWAEPRVEPGRRPEPERLVERIQERERTEKIAERPAKNTSRDKEATREIQHQPAVDFDELPVGGATKTRPKFDPSYDDYEEEAIIQAPVQKARPQNKRSIPSQHSVRTVQLDFDDIPIGTKASPAPSQYDLEQIKFDELEAQRHAEAEKKAQMELDAKRGANMALVPCRECGRSFREDKIQQHVRVCRKVFGTQRRPFDAAGQRLPEGAENCRGYDEPSPKKKDGPSKWKVQHLQFINAMRSMKQQPAGPGMPAVVQEVPDLRTECPHCQRKFNPEVADRHIPKCKNTVHKPGPPPGQRRR